METNNNNKKRMIDISLIDNPDESRSIRIELDTEITYQLEYLMESIIKQIELVKQNDAGKLIEPLFIIEDEISLVVINNKGYKDYYNKSKGYDARYFFYQGNEGVYEFKLKYKEEEYLLISEHNMSKFKFDKDTNIISVDIEGKKWSFEIDPDNNINQLTTGDIGK